MNRTNERQLFHHASYVASLLFGAPRSFGLAVFHGFARGPSESRQAKQIRYAAMRFDGMTQRRVRAHSIVVASPHSLPHQRACVRKLAQDALNGPFGDAHFVSDLAYADVVIGRDGNQHKRVITEKRPSVAVRMWFHNT